MCNFGGRINEQKSPSEKGGNRLRQCTEGHAKTLKLNLAQLLLNFNFCFTAGRFGIFTGQVQT